MDDDDLCRTKNILSMLEVVDGMKKIENLWLSHPSYDQDKIEEFLVDYFLWNDITLNSLENILSNVLFELLKDHMNQSPKKFDEKGEVQEDMQRKFTYSQKIVFESIKEMKVCVEEGAKVYKYYLQWPTTIEHFKAKIDSISLS